MYDFALEQNRRVAWARFYQAREDLREFVLLAYEFAVLAEEALGGELPPEMAEIVALIDDSLDDLDRKIVRRYARRPRLARSAA